MRIPWTWSPVDAQSPEDIVVLCTYRMVIHHTERRSSKLIPWRVCVLAQQRGERGVAVARQTSSAVNEQAQRDHMQPRRKIDLEPEPEPDCVGPCVHGE